jgi:hypothetical protein
LFCRCEESHDRRLACLSAAFLDELDILINLYCVECVLLDFPNPFVEIGSVGTLDSLDAVAKMSVHVGAFSFKEDSRVVHGCRIQIWRSLQPFEAAHSLVHAVIEQEDSFVKMGLLHDNIPFSGMAASSAVNRNVWTHVSCGVEGRP